MAKLFIPVVLQEAQMKDDGLAKSPNCPIVISTNGRNINSANWLRRKISR
jgi:hypothetical protein